MGLTARQRRVFDKKQSIKKSVDEARVYANAEKNLKKLKAGKLGRIAKLKRTTKELIGGKKTYLPKKKKG